jgi:hypothetical protein
MLTADCILAWFQRLNLPEQARSTISHIRSAGPATPEKGATEQRHRFESHGPFYTTFVSRRHARREA